MINISNIVNGLYQIEEQVRPQNKEAANLLVEAAEKLIMLKAEVLALHRKVSEIDPLTDR